jgi:hypothetical protein
MDFLGRGKFALVSTIEASWYVKTGKEALENLIFKRYRRAFAKWVVKVPIGISGKLYRRSPWRDSHLRAFREYCELRRVVIPTFST